MTTIEVSGVDVDLLADERLRDPYTHYSHMREEHPVFWSERYRGWFVHRHEDVMAALLDDRFSSDRISPALARQTPEQQQERGTTFDVLKHWMVFLDPPAHTRIRRLVMPAFAPKAVAAMRPVVEQAVDEAIAAVRDRETFDLVRDLAYPVPAVVIADLMGIPPTDRDLFKQWSDDILVLVFGGHSTPDRRERAQAGLESLTAYLREVIARLRRHPEDNVVCRLLEAEVDGARLSEDEIVATGALLVFGGHETPTNLIGNGVRALAHHPDQRRRLVDDPALVPSAGEEFLRFDGPSKLEPRLVREDLEIRGERLLAGQNVFLVQAAANRDPRVFTDPDTLDVGRRPNRHVGFGFGLHHCLGNFLARMEVTVAMTRILRDLPELVPAVPDAEVAWNPTLLSRGMASLPVRRA